MKLKSRIESAKFTWDEMSHSERTVDLIITGLGLFVIIAIAVWLY